MHCQDAWCNESAKAVKLINIERKFSYLGLVLWFGGVEKDILSHRW
jgi:hypothetical protein